MPTPASAAFGVLGLVCVGIYFLLPRGTQSVVFPIIAGGSVAAVFAGAFRHSTANRLPWLVVGGGLLGLAAGDAVFAVYSLRFDQEPPYPGLADGFGLLAGYPLLVVGLLLVLRRVGTQTNRDSLLDSAVLFTGIALLQWVFLLGPFDRTGYTGFGWALVVVTQVFDVLLLVALAQLLVTSARRNPALALLVVALGLWVAADDAFASSQLSYVRGHWLDACWLGSYVVWGAAALDSSAGELEAGRERRRIPRLTNARLVVLALALALAPAILLFERIGGRRHNAYAVAIGGLAIGILVLVRLAGLVRAVESSRRAERVARRDAESAQRLLVGQNARLVKLDRLKDEFLSSVSHELRTPLTSISGYVELLLDEEGDGNRRSYLDVIDRNAERLLALVSDLLLAARLQSGEFGLERAPVDVSRLAVEAVEAALPRAQAGGVDLAVAESGTSPAVVEGDPARLAQVLDNLVSNAIKFTPHRGSVRVAVANDDDQVVVEVVDTGIGIPPEEHENLFQRFYRTQAALERHIQGTGLGLYITKAIVDAHGGRIRVRSTGGGGTTVIVELPRVWKAQP